MSRGNEQDSGTSMPARGPMGHVDDWDELVVDYLDGRLTPETKAAVEGHLGSCPACAARVGTQESVVRFLQETSLHNPPGSLEERVLGELLFPSSHAPRPKAAEQPRTSIFWRRKIRPWIPATVAVAALLAAVVGYGLLRSDADVSTVSRDQTPSTVASQDQVPGQVSSQPESLGATTTAAAVATVATDAPTIAAASESTIPTVTQDRKAMVSNLEAAQTPAYVAFEGLAPPSSDDGESQEPVTTVPGDSSVQPEDGAISQEQLDAVVSQMIAFTGMQPLDDTRALGGPTFAAFVPRDDAQQLVDLMRSIGVSIGLAVTLGMAPPVGMDETVAHLMKRKAELPVLSATRTPQPAVSGYAFTTSTLIPAGGLGDGTSLTLPDEAGTHVLIVFYIRR